MTTINYATKSLINRRKRKQQVRRNTIILLTSIILILLISILLISFSTQANDFEHQPSYKYFKSIEISCGDTLWSIADENIDYNHYKSKTDYINEVMQMNSLTTDKITAGNYLIVPYYSSAFVSN